MVCGTSILGGREDRPSVVYNGPNTDACSRELAVVRKLEHHASKPAHILDFFGAKEEISENHKNTVQAPCLKDK
jgi:hypothetical protein